jgi:hypothetical protein
VIPAMDQTLPLGSDMPGQHNNLCLGVSRHNLDIRPMEVHHTHGARPSDDLISPLTSNTTENSPTERDRANKL